MTEPHSRTKWGRTKLGNGRMPAMALAAPSGLVVGFGLSLVAVATGIAGPNPLLGAAVFTLCLAVPATLLVWVLLVDRSTLQGAAERAEESIESRWYVSAAAGAQTDVIGAAALAALLISVVPSGSELDPRIALLGVIAVSFVSFALRYQVVQRRA